MPRPIRLNYVCKISTAIGQGFVSEAYLKLALSPFLFFHFPPIVIVFLEAVEWFDIGYFLIDTI